MPSALNSQVRTTSALVVEMVEAFRQVAMVLATDIPKPIAKHHGRRNFLASTSSAIPHIRIVLINHSQATALRRQGSRRRQEVSHTQTIEVCHRLQASSIALLGLRSRLRRTSKETRPVFNLGPSNNRTSNSSTSSGHTADIRPTRIRDSLGHHLANVLTRLHSRGRASTMLKATMSWSSLKKPTKAITIATRANTSQRRNSLRKPSATTPTTEDICQTTLPPLTRTK